MFTVDMFIVVLSSAIWISQGHFSANSSIVNNSEMKQMHPAVHQMLLILQQLSAACTMGPFLRHMQFYIFLHCLLP